MLIQCYKANILVSKKNPAEQNDQYDVFLRSPLATLFNPPLFSTPTGDTSSFSNIRYTLSSLGMSNSTSPNISNTNSQIKKS